MSGFTHFDASGHAVMVDVSEKQETQREATAKGKIYMSPECFALVKAGEMKKGDVLGVARIAGIMGAKKTSELIPLCHILNLSKAKSHSHIWRKAARSRRRARQRRSVKPAWRWRR